MPRQDHTTHFIREAAVDELVASGHAGLTMESLARRSFSSIGSVYSRFPNRIAAMLEVFESCIVPATENPPRGPGENVYGWALTQPEVMRHLRALVEISLCSRFEPALAPAGEHLLSVVSSQRADHSGVDGLDWLVGAVLVGHIVLTGAGCSIPDLVEDLQVLLECASPPGEPQVPTVNGLDAPIPPSPSPRSDDAVASRLVSATTEELAATGASRANVRRIASRSGVTTGAVYRRYDSKTDLVRDALVRELQPSRYSWTKKLVDAVTGADTATSPGDVLADQVFTLLNDRTRMLATLEMIHAARSDDAVRRTLVRQVEEAASARARLFASVPREAGSTPAISPVLMGWVIQMAPTGARVLVALGDEPDENRVRAALRRVTAAALQ